jgi:arylformamidase
MKNASSMRCIAALFASATLALWPIPASAAEDKASSKSYEVETVSDQAYYDGADADPIKHKLDLYLPKGAKDYPVVLFVHGGGWVMGDKTHFGIYSAIGQCFARQGIGAVVTNYRLSPKVQHPEHVKDVARAFAWTHKNIAKHGGRPDQLFVAGHSAGGHLVALLATDETYLKAENLALKDIRGVIPMSGVYLIAENFLPTVFGTDADVKRRASPLRQVRAGLPPFCIMYADKDMPLCDKMSATFCKALQDQKCQAETVEIKERTHISIILRFSKEDDPAMQAAVAFIQRNRPRGN